MNSRRKFIRNTALSTGAALVSTNSIAAARQEKTAEGKLKILVAGAHPDDPETGMGGTISKYTSQGHEVICLYLTSGEVGIPGTNHEQAAAIRKKEALEACKIMNTRPVFFGQIDGSCEVNSGWYDKMIQLVKQENPDMIFTHWPIDSHRDHRICAEIVFDAWSKTGKRASLYYYEVMTGSQTQNFQPDSFVDITRFAETKWKACMVHKSQKVEEFYPESHAKMEVFRGLEAGSKYGEAFVHHTQSPLGYLP